MITVEIWNFQNIKHAKLDIKGFSVLVGESNIGKTSVCRAFQCVAENIPSSGFIRHGESKAKVQITHHERAWRVTWERTEAGAKYRLDFFEELDGKVNLGKIVKTERFDKPGRSVPDPIQKLGFLRLATEDLTTQIGYASQHRYMFLLDEPKQLVQLAGELRAVSKLNNAMAAARSETRGVKDEARLLEAQHTKLRTDQKALRGCEDLEQLVQEAERATQELEQIEQEAEGLAKIKNRSSSVRAQLGQTQKTLRGLGGVEKLEGQLDLLEQIQQEIFPTETELKELQGQQFRFEKIKQAVPVLRSQIEVGERAKHLDLDALEDLTDAVGELWRIQGRLDRLQKAAQRVRSISQMDLIDGGVIDQLEGELNDLRGLRELQDRLRGVKGRVKDLKEERTKSEALLTVLEDEIRDFVNKHPICEVCGQEMSVSKLLGLS